MRRRFNQTAAPCEGVWLFNEPGDEDCDFMGAHIFIDGVRAGYIYGHGMISDTPAKTFARVMCPKVHPNALPFTCQLIDFRDRVRGDRAAKLAKEATQCPT